MPLSNVIYSDYQNSMTCEKNAQLFLVKNKTEEKCIFSQNTEYGEKKSHILPPNESGLLWLYKTTIKREGGCCVSFSVDLMRLAKLQAFIDRVFDVKLSKYIKQPFFHFFNVPQLKSVMIFQDIEYWYMGQVYGPDEAHDVIVPFIRSTEWYQLVAFLVKESNSEEISIQQLSEKYGLSSSYFRFLCKQVLGGTLKGQISDWRLATALIDMIKSQLSATDVAYKAGYSSLSHFSKEVKKAMGHSTRDLKKLILS